MRIVIELKRDANANIVLNNLYKHSQMEDTISIIMLSLVNGVPKVLNLKEMIYYYVEHFEGLPNCFPKWLYHFTVPPWM